MWLLPQIPDGARQSPLKSWLLQRLKIDMWLSGLERSDVAQSMALQILGEIGEFCPFYFLQCQKPSKAKQQQPKHKNDEKFHYLKKEENISRIEKSCYYSTCMASKIKSTLCTVPREFLSSSGSQP